MTRPCESGLHDGVARERRARGGAAGCDGASPRVGWHLAVRRRDDSGPHRGAPPVPLGTALLTQLLIAEKWLQTDRLLGLHSLSEGSARDGLRVRAWECDADQRCAAPPRPTRATSRGVGRRRAIAEEFCSLLLICAGCAGTSVHSDYVLMLSSGDTHDILLRCAAAPLARSLAAAAGL